MSIDILNFTALGLRFALASTDFFLATMFFLKIKIARKTGIDLSQFLGLAIFFLFYGISRIFFIYNDYYFFQFGTDIMSFYKIACLSGYIGIIGLVFLSEKMLGKTKYAFTIFNLICFVYGIFFVESIIELRLFTYVTLPISMIAFSVLFSISYFFKTSGIIRRKMGLAIDSFILFELFVVLNTRFGADLMLNLLNIPKEITLIISEAGIIASSLLCGISILSFETLTELGWREKLKELFIIAPNGSTILHYSFIKELESRDPDLITSGLSGVKAILAEMMQSKETLKVVDHRDVKILFEYGTYVTIALVSSENLSIYHSKLANLIKQFENLFYEVLCQWIGDIEVFLPAKHLIKEIFS